MTGELLEQTAQQPRLHAPNTCMLFQLDPNVNEDRPNVGYATCTGPLRFTAAEVCMVTGSVIRHVSNYIYKVHLIVNKLHCMLPSHNHTFSKASK